jgi:hypothetical protein
VRHTYIIRGAGLADTVFSVTLPNGEFAVWNVTKLRTAASTGAFGPPRSFEVADLPPPNWTEWTAADRESVDWMKTSPILNEPALAIAPPPGIPFEIGCFADGRHRITARQEMGLATFSTYLVPWSAQDAFRIKGLPREVGS